MFLAGGNRWPLRFGMTMPEVNKRVARRAESVQPETAPKLGEGRGMVLAVIAVVLFLYAIRVILLPFVIAGIVAYVCTPLIDWLAKRTGWPRPLFAFLMFVLLVGVAAAILALAGQRFITEAGNTINDMQGTLEHLLRQTFGDQPVRLFGQPIDVDAILRGAGDHIRDWFGQSDNLAMVAANGLFAVMGVFLTVALLLWFLLSGKAAAGGLLWLVPPSRRGVVGKIWSRLDPILKHYFMGVVAIVIYATIAAYVGLALILGIDHAVLLALMTGVAETLPIIGSTAVAIIAGLTALHQAAGIMSVVAFAIYATVLRLSIDQVVAPLVLGRAANVHPVLIIFCFLAGAVTFGITGVILSVPMALTVKTALATLYGESDK
jgi:predicted PurR-regulated permease PerM